MANTTPETIKAARKKHRCCWCWEHIEVGNSYVRFRYFDGGDASTSRLHPECDAAAQRMAQVEGYDFEYTPGQFNRGCICESGDDCGCRAMSATPPAAEGK